MTSNTGPILVFPRIQPFGSYDFSSLGKVYSRHATDSVNCENSSVSFVMKYCPTPTVVRNPQVLITRFCCESLSTRSWYFCNWSSCAGSSGESVGVFVNKLVGTNNGSDSPANTSLSVLTWQALYSSHKSETAPVDTELIDRNNCAKKQFQSFSHQRKSVLIISHPPLLFTVPRDSGLVARKTGCPLSPNFYHSRFSDSGPIPPCGRLS